MKNSKSQRGTNRIKPRTPIRSRQATAKPTNMAKNIVERTPDFMAKSVSQGSLVVKQGFLSALKSMKNADLLVKLSERFSKREKNK